MGNTQRAGWVLIAVAALVSAGIVTTEVVDLVRTENPESSDTLPVIGFEPIPED